MRIFEISLQRVKRLVSTGLEDFPGSPAQQLEISIRHSVGMTIRTQDEPLWGPEDYELVNERGMSIGNSPGNFLHLGFKP